MKTIKKLLLIAVCILYSGSLFSQIVIGGYNVYYGHLHNHSNVSDGTNTPDAAYNYAKNTGKLDFFSLADHSSYLNSTNWAEIKTAADKYNQDGVFTAFWGFEWTENVLGHVAVINSQNYITTASPYNTFAGLTGWLNSNECIAFFNHPGRNNSTGHEFEHFTTTASDKIVGMELWNKTDRFPVYYYTDGYYTGDGNLSWFDEAIMRGWKVGAAGSEDNHSGTWGTMTTSKLAIMAAAKTRTDLYNAMKARRFFTTYDKNLAMSFKINSSEMGSVLASGTHSFQIQLSDADSEVFSQVQLLKNGAVYQTWTPNVSAVNLTGTLTCTTGEYYYVRVKQTDSDEAISSPIWIGTTNQLPTGSITSPVKNDNFSYPATLSISASASDPDGTVQKVEFYQGSTLIGTDTSAPWSCTWSGMATGIYTLTARIYDNSGGTASTSPVIISVTNPGDPVPASSMIATGLDDVEESSTGNLSSNINSTDIELVNDSGTGAGNQTVGLRFTGMNIPKGASIISAQVQFTCDEVTTGTCSLTIKGEASDNSSSFTTAAYNVSARVKTTATVGWIPAAWNTIGQASSAQLTPDLSSVLQEIVNRTGYTASSALTFIITGSGTRTADSFEGSPTTAAKLVVTYSKANLPPVVSITSPVNNATYPAPASLTVSATATDSDGIITKVDFFNGSTLLGTDTSSPWSFNWSGIPVGTYTITAKATDDDGAVTTSSAVKITVNVPVYTITQRISAGSDDVEENVKGSVVLNGDDLELVYDGKANGSQVVGLRFNNIQVPKGAIINSASIQFTADEKTSNTCPLVIRGENVDNALPFTTTARNVSGRTPTIALVNWSPANWTVAGQTAEAQKTPDLASVVAEIVNRSGWISGNSMVFILSGTGTNKRTAESYEGSSSKCALLTIVYALPGSSLKSGILTGTQGHDLPILPRENGAGRVSCYPVPFSSRLFVQLYPAKGEQIEILEVFNSGGSRIRLLTEADRLTELNLSDADPGVYVLRVRTNFKTYVTRVIKQ